MSLTMALTRGLLRLMPKSTATADSLREAAAKRTPAAAVPAALKRIAHVEHFVVNGRPVIRLTPKTGASGAHLIYTHGGVYVFSIVAPQWRMLTTLLAESGVSITVPLYGLAPDHHVGDAYRLLDALYDEAVEQYGERVFLGGDSAGGGLALGQAIRYRDSMKPSPAGLILFSPWVDATMSNPEIARLAPLDPMLGPEGFVEAALWWADGVDLRSPLISPLFAELGGLPPVFSYVGDRDILFADAKALTRRITAAGGETQLRVYRGGIHDFVGASWTPEARRALAHAAARLRG